MRRMFLNGTAMAGQRDHHAVVGATFLGPRRTAPLYRFYAVRDEFPGLVAVDEGGGRIAGELYEMPDALLFDSLLPEEPPELELGTITLDDGEVVNSMHLRRERVADGDTVVDITEHGGWHAYRAALRKQSPGPVE